MTKTSEKTRNLVQMAILVAVMLILAFTPLGYLRISSLGLEITFMTIPVVVGAILTGPAGGAFLGCVFGLTSFAQCFGMSPFGSVLLGINPVYTFIVCVAPRAVMGFLTGEIFKILYRHDKTKWLSFAAASLAGPVLNTVLFTGTLMLFFGSSDYIRQMRGGMGIFSFLAVFVGVQGLVEAIVSFILGTAISKALSVFLKR